MKYLVFILCAMLDFDAHAYFEDPHHSFDMTHNEANSFDITFRQVNNVQQACDSESRRRGGTGFGYSVEACSFWNESVTGRACTVITAKKVNFHTLGHEVRHCLQGNWHDLRGEIK